MSTSTRFVVEGTWSGYTSSQSRVVHRSVHKPAERKFRAWAEQAGPIQYTDGTCLFLRVRDCKPRERVEVRNSYGRLIRDCFYADVYRVEDLKPEARK